MSVIMKTCSACRSRKVRCDGMHPVCGPCSRARKAVECSYTVSQSPPTSRGSLLQKGAACFPCRKKKKKCNAKRPSCTTCAVAGKASQCIYEDNANRTLTEALIARTLALEQRLSLYEPGRQPEMSSSGTASIDDDMSVNVNPSPGSAQAVVATESNEFLASISIILDSFTPAMPDLGDSQASNANVSSGADIISPLAHPPQNSVLTSLHDLYECRAVFLAHKVQYGITLSQQKITAILVGDTSGRMVHPAYIYIAQLLGSCDYSPFKGSPFDNAQMCSLQQALAEYSDPMVTLQIHALLFIYHLRNLDMSKGRDHLTRAVQTATQYNLPFALTLPDIISPTQEQLSEFQEKLSALSELLYLDQSSGLVLGFSSLLPQEYEQQIMDLINIYSNICKSDPAALRAKSVTLLQRARGLSISWIDMNTRVASAEDTWKRSQWYDEYWRLLQEITDHIATLSPSLMKSTYSLQYDIGLGYKIISDHHNESRQKCLAVAFEIVTLTKGLQDEDYVYLDPILGPCWLLVVNVLKRGDLSKYGRVESLEAITHIGAIFCAIFSSASKLGDCLPFMENSLKAISDVVSGQSAGCSKNDIIEQAVSLPAAT